MSLLNKLLGKEESQNKDKYSVQEKSFNSIEKIDESIFESAELLQIAGEGVLDTNSPLAIRKMQHNLKILTQKAKQEGKIDRFMLIRDDDFFSLDWQWRVSSKNTCILKTRLSLSDTLRTEYALEEAGLVNRVHGLLLPVSKEDTDKALSNVDKDVGSLFVPAHFRSTKHFTINTPLGVTGNYNSVAQNRNFTIMDDISSFLSSGYGYSVAYRDAYLDVTHESLPISKEAIVLIEESRYHKIIEDPIISEQLKSRKVIVYRGDEYLAINMILSEQGILPSQMGDKYFHYDEEIQSIIDTSVQDLAKTNHLLYNQNHGGPNGHFTDFYDEKNLDYQNSIEQFVQFLQSRFPEHSQIITTQTIQNAIFAGQIIKTIGTKDLLHAIEEYNVLFQKQFYENVKSYVQDRSKITPEISEIFQKTVMRIQVYYLGNEKDTYDIETQKLLEDKIQHFYQDRTVQEQLVCANTIWNTLHQTINLEYQSSNPTQNGDVESQEEYRRQK